MGARRYKQEAFDLLPKAVAPATSPGPSGIFRADTAEPPRCPHSREILQLRSSQQLYSEARGVMHYACQT